MGIEPADLLLDENGIPYSDHYQDTYYSRKNGLEESRYVFIEGNQLSQNWQNKAVFTIAETGFGTGLNFLATWKHWKHDENRPERLHYISIEKHPLTSEQLRKTLSHWGELEEFTDQLITQYPVLLPGFHRLPFEDHKVTLTLCFMPAEKALEQLDFPIDAWYLDGFAPAKNPDLWNQQTIQGIAHLSHEQTTLATFTAASAVRKQLLSAGFDVSKRKGFGKKREMLTAKAHQPFVSSQAVWFQLPKQTIEQKQVVIIGGGIAGCQAAWHLAQRGWEITLIERHKKLAQEASGNKAGVIIPKMTAKESSGETFYTQSFLYALQQLKKHSETSPNTIQWSMSGALQLNHNEREAQRWQALQKRQLPKDFLQCVNQEEASNIANLSLPTGASYFPQAAWLNPASFCEALCQHNNISVIYETEALALEQQENDWIIKNEKDQVIASSNIVIIANGKDADTFPQTNFLPFTPVAGQTNEAKAETSLKTIIGHEGYLTPAINEHHIYGATFDRGNKHAQISKENTDKNTQQLKQILPELIKHFNGSSASHAAVRMTTPDRFPYIGPIPNKADYLKNYSDLHQGKHWKNYPPANYQQGLYIMAGFASRGLTTTGLCAEMLASILNQEPTPFQKTLQEQLHPARFLIRQLKRKNS
jgi:tRNA 5-methylaminomethyl-2-thiouridine biosynthesis bifunctional protein